MEVMHTSEVGKTVGQSVLSHHEVLYGACEKCAICMWISPRKTHCGCAVALIVLWFSNISCFWCVHGDVLQTHRMSRRSLLCDYLNHEIVPGMTENYGSPVVISVMIQWKSTASVRRRNVLYQL